MALRSAARAVAAVLVAHCLLQVGGCGTDAVGVDACQDIELSRCDAAAACGTIDDAAACRRFYHDQCLHGLPVPNPGQSAVTACVAMIERARVCAAEGGPEAELGECRESVSSAAAVTGVCELVATPEFGAECRFLDPDSEPSGNGTGGRGEPGGGGSGGEPAGEGGSGGEPASGEPSAGSAGLSE